MPLLKPKTIALDNSQGRFFPVLLGPPETCTMRSGFVTLQPGESVGKHSTGANEELVVVLGGEGIMKIPGRPDMKLTARMVAYCPPETEHDVHNTGTVPLEYLYTVAHGKTPT